MDEKELGNRAFGAKEFSQAITHFTRCIELDPTCAPCALIAHTAYDPTCTSPSLSAKPVYVPLHRAALLTTSSEQCTSTLRAHQWAHRSPLTAH